jgi:hypothetical protein
LPTVGLQLVPLVADLGLLGLEVLLQRYEFLTGLGARLDQRLGGSGELLVLVGDLTVLLGLPVGGLPGHLHDPSVLATTDQNTEQESEENEVGKNSRFHATSNDDMAR